MAFYDSLFTSPFCVKSSECLSLYASTSFLSFYYLLLHEVSPHCSFAAGDVPSDVAFLISFLSCWLLYLGRLWNPFQLFIFVFTLCLYKLLRCSLLTLMIICIYQIEANASCSCSLILFILPHLHGHHANPKNLELLTYLSCVHLFMGHSSPLYLELSFITEDYFLAQDFLICCFHTCLCLIDCFESAC